jgi:hypothetical protein
LAAAVSLAVLVAITRDLPGVEFGPRTVRIAGGVAAFYLLSAAMVWLGVPPGFWLSRVCSLLYLPRPSFGFRVWDAMRTEGFRAHFRRGTHPWRKTP